MQDIANIDRYHLPLTAYRIEGWNMQNDDNDGLVIYHPPVTSFAHAAEDHRRAPRPPHPSDRVSAAVHHARIEART